MVTASQSVMNNFPEMFIIQRRQAKQSRCTSTGGKVMAHDASEPCLGIRYPATAAFSPSLAAAPQDSLG